MDVYFHTIFHFSVVDKAFVAPVNLYLVIGFNDLKRGSVTLPCCKASSKAPNKALVAGGYFNARRTKVLISLSVKFLIMAKNRLQDAFILASGIFLI